jgi:hypothetical protein
LQIQVLDDVEIMLLLKIIKFLHIEQVYIEKQQLTTRIELMNGINELDIDGIVDVMLLTEKMMQITEKIQFGVYQKMFFLI